MHVSAYQVVAQRFASEDFAVPVIENAIVLAILMAVAVSSAAYAGFWMADKWAVLTGSLNWALTIRPLSSPRPTP